MNIINSKFCTKGGLWGVGFIATSNNISDLSWRSTLLVGGNGVTGKHHRPAASTPRHGYFPLVISTYWSFSHSWLITGFATRSTQRVPLVDQVLFTSSGAPEFTLDYFIFLSLVLCVYFVDRFCPFSVGHCVVLNTPLVSSISSRFELTALVVTGNDCIGSCKSNYHTTTTAHVGAEWVKRQYQLTYSIN